MYDREWYNKVPIKEINELIKCTGWDVRNIFLALSIQESELKVKKAETWGIMKNYHWEEQEYKERLPLYNEIIRKMEHIGEE